MGMFICSYKLKYNILQILEQPFLSGQDFIYKMHALVNHLLKPFTHELMKSYHNFGDLVVGKN